MTVLEAVPMERIEAEAAEVDYGRGARRVVAALFYWPGRAVGVMVDALSIVGTAWKLGYRDGRRRPAAAPASTQGSAG